MALFQSNNPVLKESTFQQAAMVQDGSAMTLRGTVNKMAFLLAMVMAAAAYTWGVFYKNGNIVPYLAIGAIGGFILALVIVFKRDWAPYLAPAYALCEGAFLGAISALYASKFEGIVLQAVGLTFGTFIAMLALYRFGVIRATQRFKAIIVTATAGIAVFYLIAMGLRFFNIEMPYLHDSSTIGIVLSLVIVAVAALNLILDFDLIERGIAGGAPKSFEWFAAFGLLVTLVWLYLEILRLLSKLNRR
ncbi:Bax inhibitor-1/YccA family protein [Chitinophaga agrisoli]|uniref:Bax inhibitor-1/YccA family protein n=1 Tax=Chitinophaga agrisoli TaxID=2607653 RepID=A0A5B2W4R2_9BACT|nr:Bax inhibitor-1/YccA family protein [Chitinophaga agrisoli]KAA2245546.1 Bax inhibitor-1/YccA family protein [Chitinophaga agrisoli]